MQYGEGVPGEETRGASSGRSGDADRNIRGGTSSRAGEYEWGSGVGFRVNVRESGWKRRERENRRMDHGCKFFCFFLISGIIGQNFCSNLSTLIN